MRFLFALLALATVVRSHICMWEPLQRGAFAINTPGADPCYRKVGPCGNVSGDPNKYTVLQPGQPFSITFQQNLNHFYFNQPGFIDASFAIGSNPSESDFTVIGAAIPDFNAMNEIFQQNFTIPITVPNQLCENCVIRVRYVSNNPKENDRGEIFYQCADIKIRNSDAPKPASPAPSSPASAAVQAVFPFGSPVEGVKAAEPCCAPPQWTLMGYETGSWREPTHLAIYYDALNQFMRVDTFSGQGSGSSIYDGAFRMYMNFSSGIEWYYNVRTGQCSAYGLDFWNDWCYGPGQNENYATSINLNGNIVDIWQNNNLFFGSTRGSCAPILFNRQDTGALTMYYNVTVGAPNPAVFVPPSVCHFTEDAKPEAIPADHRKLLSHIRNLRF